MTTVLNHAPQPRPAPRAYKVDISRGRRIGRVSSEWFSRPDDERFLSLGELAAAVRARAERARTRTVETRQVRVEAARDNAERLALIIPGRNEPVAPTHWSFGQLAGLVGAPAGYLRQLPTPLAAINLQHGLLAHRGELMKTLETDDGRTELRAVTGPDYGRIWDHELVDAVMKIAGNGTGDTRWKVPGLLDWSTMHHNPHVEITRDTTTLYARNADPFSEIGKLQVAVDVSSVIRASNESFRIAWTERRYQEGILAATERWSAIVTIAIQTPRTPDALRRNPLGVFVNALNWSKELTQ